jgi:hypothetical protein
MDSLQKAAVLTKLVQELRERESWTGETHIQKAGYLLQEFLDVPLGFEFVLYWHGPFSFDLREELSSLWANEFVKVEPQRPPYGPRYSTTEQAEYIQRLYPKTLAKYDPSVVFVANTLQNKGVAELERLATACYVTRKMPYADEHDRAEELSRLKPHVSPENAIGAVGEADDLIARITSREQHQSA